MRPDFRLHLNETTSAAITRMYKYIRTIQRDYVPQTHCAARIQYKKSMKPLLKLVK